MTGSRGNERGQSLPEYALIVGMIAILAVAGLQQLNTMMGLAFTGIGNDLVTATSGGSTGGAAGGGITIGGPPPPS